MATIHEFPGGGVVGESGERPPSKRYRFRVLLNHGEKRPYTVEVRGTKFYIMGNGNNQPDSLWIESRDVKEGERYSPDNTTMHFNYAYVLGFDYVQEGTLFPDEIGKAKTGRKGRIPKRVRAGRSRHSK